MDGPYDPGVRAVLKELGISHADLLGHGGEAWVYALDAERVVRVLHVGGRASDIERRRLLVDELHQAAPSFALPEILEVGEIGDRVYAIERRFPGKSVMDALPSTAGRQRRLLIESHLDAAASLGDLHLEHRRFGDLLDDDPITTETWPDYLVERATANLARSTDDFWSIDASDLVDELPEAAVPAFVHLDAFAGNMLTDGTAITAVIDIGATSVAGDRRFDPLSAAIYLIAPEITPVVIAADIDVAMSWLRATGLDQWFDPVRRWLAAYWSAAVDEPDLLQWCRRVLIDHA
jgi:hypothetical protein